KLPWAARRPSSSFHLTGRGCLSILIMGNLHLRLGQYRPMPRGFAANPWSRRMRSAVLLPVCFTLALLLPQRAASWHRDGHHAIARIAWKQLDAGQQLAVAQLLKAHPHYDIYLADQRPKELISEVEWSFLRSSTWADWVRDPMAA